jgi:mRNA interferase HicA
VGWGRLRRHRIGRRQRRGERVAAAFDHGAEAAHEVGQKCDRRVYLPLDRTRHICLYWHMNSSQFRRYLAKQGCTFEEGRKHTLVHRGGKVAALPRHGGSKQLGTGLMNTIKRDLGIE